MRLVDADALRDAMYHEAFETDSDMQRWDSGCWIRYKMFEKAIESAPTIDPVKHGKWIYNLPKFTWIGNAIDYRRWKCSECEEGSENNSDYCPNCGARMDG